MPITKYTQPIQAEYVQQYQPLPLQAIANAAQAREKRHQEALARRDKFIRTAQQIPTATEQGQQLVNQKLQEARQRISDVAQDGDFSNAMYDVQNIAADFQADEQIQNIIQSAPARQEYNEQVDKAVQEGQITPRTARIRKARSLDRYQPGQEVFSGLPVYAEDIQQNLVEAAKDIEESENVSLVQTPYGIERRTIEGRSYEKVRNNLRQRFLNDQGLQEQLAEEYMDKQFAGDPSIRNYENVQDYVNSKLENYIDKAARTATTRDTNYQKLVGRDDLGKEEEATSDLSNLLTAPTPAEGMQYRLGTDEETFEGYRNLKGFVDETTETLSNITGKLRNITSDGVPTKGDSDYREYQRLQEQKAQLEARTSTFAGIRDKALRKVREEVSPNVRLDDTGRPFVSQTSSDVQQSVRETVRKRMQRPKNKRGMRSEAELSENQLKEYVPLNLPGVEETYYARPSDRPDIENLISQAAGDETARINRKARDLYEETFIEESKQAFKVPAQVRNEFVIPVERREGFSTLFVDRHEGLRFSGEDTDGNDIDSDSQEDIKERLQNGTLQIRPKGFHVTDETGEPYVRADIIDPNTDQNMAPIEYRNVKIKGGVTSSLVRQTVGNTYDAQVALDKYLDRRIQGDVEGQDETVSIPQKDIETLGYNVGFGDYKPFKDIRITRVDQTTGDPTWKLDIDIGENLPVEVEDVKGQTFTNLEELTTRGIGGKFNELVQKFRNNQ